ncbi:C-type lectin domain family 4 member E-like isoform X2 [Salvelinus namaycush]|uniref:C-type lectin domain family 4 member E-like isoform X2 n=1 Tax=Salvelinus namaycush TaxID=8040 RepID=A0A8U1F3K2_SALNM|nr:C-type lectin domain family 4 member E-like isoform X2 [Salvelinus namaycush]
MEISPPEMDSIQYDEFGTSDIESNHSRRKIIPQRGMQSRVVHLLYGVLVLLLLIILLITGLKFSQLNQAIVDVHIYFESLNKTVMSACATSSSSDPATINQHYYDEFQLPVRGTCSEEWWSFQDSCYLASKRKLNWNSAEEKCIELGAQLLVLNSEDELDYISQVIDAGERYWVGLVERTQEGHWTWVDGTDYKSTPHFWDKGQPDNWQVGVSGEDCGQLHDGPHRRRKLWNDADCNLTYNYICEAKGK